MRILKNTKYSRTFINLVTQNKKFSNYGVNTSANNNNNINLPYILKKLFANREMQKENIYITGQCQQGGPWSTSPPPTMLLGIDIEIGGNTFLSQ